MDYAIRPAQKSDASAMYQISVQAHTQSYYRQLIPDASFPDFMNYYQASSDKEQRFVSLLNEKSADINWFSLVAESEGHVIGYMLAQRLSRDVVQLKGLFVNPAYHRHGIGSALFKASLQLAGEGVTVRLSLIAANTVARNVYVKNGFTAVATDAETFFGAELVTMERKR